MKKDLLLLHGAIGASDQFDPILPFLKEDFNCLTIDFSGHGKNKEQNRPFTIKLFTEDVLEWMTDNNKETIDIFGYSMGGYVALYLAYLHPNKVGRIFTLSTKFNWTNENAANETKLLNADKIEEKIPKFAHHLSKLHLDWKMVLQKTIDLMLKLGKGPDLNPENLKLITNTVLVATGDHDNTATPEETYDTFHHLENAQILILPDTKHPFEQIDHKLIATHLIKFFNN